MKGKTIFRIIWSVAALAAIILIGARLASVKVYTTTEIEFNDVSLIQIDADKVTFQAVSDEFFVLRKVSGEVITGIPAPVPFGWSIKQYFIVGPQEIPGGDWLLATGEALMRITSDTPVTVHITPSSPAGYWFVTIFFGTIVWAIAFFLIKESHQSK